MPESFATIHKRRNSVAADILDDFIFQAQVFTVC
jgi:hypothetical protein